MNGSAEVRVARRYHRKRVAMGANREVSALGRNYSHISRGIGRPLPWSFLLSATVLDALQFERGLAALANGLTIEKRYRA